ncbi:uncharacterized protein LOC5505275 isoform X2 [Nematostella vectensis]|uniref:uncharacterized protein LOC5505275 isoform X2 n=1 Tax=Nematostella vectensis TaxID=45351 RepID=UPI0020771D12|nr:uncharacterized protein LOC5505275 isoform X2 [Nematostella vectensis]
MNRALVPSPLPTEEGILNFLLFSILQYFKSRFYHGTRLEAAHLKIRDFTRRHPIIAQLAFLAALPVTIIGSSVLCFCAIVGSICFGILSCIALFWICAALLLASPFLAPCACITTIAAMLYLVLNFIVHDVIYGLRLRPPRLHQGVWTFITDLRHIVTTIARYLIGLINQLYSDPWTSLTHLFIAKAPRRVQLLFGWVFRFVPGDSYIWTRPRANMFGEYSESQASVLTSQIIGVNRREKPQRRQASVKSFLSYYAAQLMPNQWQENATALKQDILDMFLWHTPRLIPQRWVTRVVFLPMWVPRLFVRSFCACVDGTFRRAFAYVWRILSHLLSLVSRARDFAIHSLWQLCSSFGRVKSLPTWVVQLVGTWYYERLAKIASCVFGEWRISSKAITLKGNLPPRHQSYLDRTLRLITLHMDQVHVVLTRNPVIVGILALVFTPAFLTLSPMWVPLLFVRSFCACVDGTFRHAFAHVWRILSHLLSLVSRARDFAIHSLWQVCSSFGRVKSLPTWVVQLVGTWYYERLAKIASCVFGEWRISSKAITLKGNLPPRHQSYLDRTLRLITLHMDQVHVVLTRNPVIVGILALVFTPAFLTLSPMWVPLLFVRSFCACVDGTFRRAFAYVWRILSHLLSLVSRARDLAIHSLWQVCSSFGRVKSLPTWVVQLVGTWYYERLAKIASCVFGEWRISSKAITLKGNLPPRHQSYLNRTLRLITLHMDQVHVVLTRNPVIVGILALVFTPAFLTLSPVLLEFAAIWLVYRVTKRVVKFFAKCLEAIFVMITHLEHAILRNIFLAIRLCRQLVAKISRAIRFTINTIATLLRITVNAVKFFIACLNPFFLLGVMRRAALWIFWSYFRAVYIFFDVFTSERISKRLPALAEYFDAKPTAIHQPMTSEDDPCDSQSSSEHFIRIIYTRFNPDESDSDGQASTDIPLTTDVSASSSFDHTPLTPRYDSDVNAIESVESLGRSLPRFDTLYKGRMHDPMETSPSSKAIVKVHKNKHPNLSISPPRSEPEMENASKPEVAKAPSSLKERAQYNTVPKLVRQLRVSKQQLQEWRNTPYLVTVSKEQRKAIESTMRESKDEQVAQTKAACEASEELKQSSQGSHDDPGVKEVADVFGWIFIWVIFPSACFVWYYAYTCVKEYYLNNYY